MCQVFSKESFEEYIKENKKTGDLKEESLLHIIGYNVNQNDNLSDETRHKILEYAIESRLMSRKQIERHLKYLIQLNEGAANRELAIRKWNADRDWIMGYKSSGEKLVGIKYIVE